MKIKFLAVVVSVYSMFLYNYTYADDGYRLWLKYDLISDTNLLENYSNIIQAIMINGDSPTIQIAKKEITNGLTGLLRKSIPIVSYNFV